MKASQVIKALAEIIDKFGDIEVTGGAMSYDVPLSKVSVTDIDGMEVWPNNPNGLPEPHHIDGVFFE